LVRSEILNGPFSPSIDFRGHLAVRPTSLRHSTQQRPTPSLIRVACPRPRFARLSWLLLGDATNLALRVFVPERPAVLLPVRVAFRGHEDDESNHGNYDDPPDHPPDHIRGGR